MARSRTGSLTGAITSSGGTVDGLGGSASLTVGSCATTLNTTTGANSYTGATTVSGGSLFGGAANAFSAASATSVTGGTLDLGGNSQTVGSLAGTGIVTNSGVSGTATLTNQGASSQFDGVIQDGATAVTALTQNAPGNTLTLTGTNTYTGATTNRRGRAGVVGGGEHCELERGRARDRRRFRYLADDRGRLDPDPGQYRRRPDGDRLPRRADF